MYCAFFSQFGLRFGNMFFWQQSDIIAIAAVVVNLREGEMPMKAAAGLCWRPYNFISTKLNLRPTDDMALLPL